MTASTVKSTMATAVAAPGTGANMLLPQVHGIYRHVQDAITVATTSLDDIGDTVLLCPLPSNAILNGLSLTNTAVLDSGSTLTFRIGLFYLDANGAANVSGTELTTANAILSTASTALRSVNTTPVQLAWINRSLVADKDKRLWELGGLTTDCGGWLALGIKVVAAAGTPVSADVQLIASYFLG